KQVEKEYYVQVDGIISQDALELLKTGVDIKVEGEKYTSLPCKAYILNNPPSLPQRSKKIRDERHGPTSWVSITITEGKFRQVGKMTAAVGNPQFGFVGCA